MNQKGTHCGKQPKCEQKACASADNSKNRVLDKKLTNETSSRSTDGHPESHFTSSRDTSRKQETSNIRAGNEQQRKYRTEHDGNLRQFALSMHRCRNGRHGS